MNPRAAINDLLPFQGSPFGQLGYFSKLPYLLSSSDIYLCRSQRQVILYLGSFMLSSTFLTFFEALSNFLSRTRLCCFVSFAATLIFYQSLSGLSSTFFIFLIPSPDRLDDSLTACISQAPLFLHFRRNV